MKTGSLRGLSPNGTQQGVAAWFRPSCAVFVLKHLGMLAIGVAGVVAALAFLFRKTLGWLD